MASTDGVSVEYKPDQNDVEAAKAEIKSPAKNRLKGTAVTPCSGEEKKSKRIPVMFERSSKSVWDPKFDTKILEDQHTISSFPQTRRRFQYALGYIIILCVIWAIYFGVSQLGHWEAFLAGVCVLFGIVVAILVFTFSTVYQRLMTHTSIALSILLCVFGLMSFVYNDPDMSAVGTFAGSIEILLMMYTVIPLPLYMSVIIGVLYSIAYEVLSAVKTDMNEPSWIIARALLHICIHMIGIHIFIMGQVRKRSTFLKVGQSIMSRRDLAIEKALKQKMIYSLMPQKVANEVMQSKDKKEDENKEEGAKESAGRGSVGRGSSTPDDSGKLTFRTFHMSQLDNVSILFADIVGFTKMSSNKTAEHLVSLLNDLFGRFDVICTESGCEKISTLGDCYYCVSGCPEAKPDHAKCCVEMGIRMCTAIKEFDEDHNEAVNMRVGVHTGTVLCGLVGTRRFKFDVWSHDVTLANTMESEGRPGLVHISHATYTFIKDMYEVESGEPVEDIRKHKVLIEHYNKLTQQYAIRHIQDEATIATYFITGKKGPNGEMIDLRSNDVKPLETKPEEGVGADGIKLSIEADHKEDEQQGPTENNLAMKALCNHKVLPVLGQEVEVVVEVESDASSLEQKAALDLSIDRDSEGQNSESQILLPPSNNHDNNHNNTTTTSPIKVFKSGDISQLIELYTLNDMSTTQLLEKREEMAASLENLNNGTESKANGQAKTALMEQLQIKRDSRIGQEECDQLLVSAMKADAGLEDYLYRPPINQCSLNFLSNKLEREYRNHYIEDTQFKEANLALPRFSALADMIVSFLFFVMISLCCFLGFGASIPWIIVFVFALLVEIFMLLPVLCDICIIATFSPMLAKIGRFLSSWWPRHVFGCIIASLPTLAVYANFSCHKLDTVNYSDVFYCLVLVASLLHYCNFTMLSSWMKSTVASVAGLVLLILIVIGVCMPSLWGTPQAMDGVDMLNVTTLAPETFNTTMSKIFSGRHPLKHEVILNMALLLFLIWFLNREFEISYRLCFHGDKQAVIDKQKMAQEKDQADWLLHNIIPKHVAEVLKQTSQYCRNHKEVGVIFAKVSNFDDFYDESFEGGKEYLRVLNEMYGDFEDLFDDPKYKDVEKIKTIGSCLMAASGLNPTTRNQNKDPDAHLYALMDFAIDLLGKLEQFNAEIFNFDFEMAIGFNYGEVTSGVIGTTKLLYDIWGDTVNISSRMYSTGVKGKIQVTEDTAKKLEKMFDFEYRGQIFVKGKGDMSTYILVGKKPGASWD